MGNDVANLLSPLGAKVRPLTITTQQTGFDGDVSVSELVKSDGGLALKQRLSSSLTTSASIAKVAKVLSKPSPEINPTAPSDRSKPFEPLALAVLGLTTAQVVSAHAAPASTALPPAIPALPVATPVIPQVLASMPSVQPKPTPSLVVDLTPPVVSFRYENQIVGSNQVDVWGNVSGPAGTTVEVYANGRDLGAATITGTTWHFATQQLPAGNYSFSAIATTTAGITATFGGIPSLTVGTVSGSLDMSKYKTIWRQDFTTSTAINRDIFPIVYGNADQFSFGANGLTLSSHRSESFANVGIQQPNWQSNLSQGYGLYSITASMPAGQGGGIAILLWPANNVWPGPEIDILENWNDPTNKTGSVSVHFKGPNGEDMVNAIQISVDLTKPNTYALDWENGHLGYYINGAEIFEINGTEVPKDFAHGGINAAFGAQITDIGTKFEPTDTVQLTIADMNYKRYMPTWWTSARPVSAPVASAISADQAAMAALVGSTNAASTLTPIAQPSIGDTLFANTVSGNSLPLEH